MRHQKEEDYLSGNLTAMIDVVFQLIIFFVCTISMQEQTLNAGIELAMAKDSAPVTTKDPNEINIDVSKNGVIMIAKTPISYTTLVKMLSATMANMKGAQVPVIIRGDRNARHEGVKAVMDACATAGIYKIKFAAMKEKGG